MRSDSIYSRNIWGHLSGIFLWDILQGFVGVLYHRMGPYMTGLTIVISLSIICFAAWAFIHEWRLCQEFVRTWEIEKKKMAIRDKDLASEYRDNEK